jgi:hypothetical protein
MQRQMEWLYRSSNTLHLPCGSDTTFYFGWTKARLSSGVISSQVDLSNLSRLFSCRRVTLQRRMPNIFVISAK